MFSFKCGIQFILLVLVIFPIEFGHGVVFPVGERSFIIYYPKTFVTQFKRFREREKQNQTKLKLLKQILLENSVYF